MAGVKALEGQCFFDIAIQECGVVEAAFDLAKNNNRPVTDNLVAGEFIETVEPLRKQISDYYKNNNIKPATGFSSFDTPVETVEEGISIWAINIDFIVQ